MHQLSHVQAFLVACKVASHLGVGPVFILVSIIFAIFREYE